VNGLLDVQKQLLELKKAEMEMQRQIFMLKKAKMASKGWYQDEEGNWFGVSTSTVCCISDAVSFCTISETVAEKCRCHNVCSLISCNVSVSPVAVTWVIEPQGMQSSIM